MKIKTFVFKSMLKKFLEISVQKSLRIFKDVIIYSNNSFNSIQISKNKSKTNIYLAYSSRLKRFARTTKEQSVDCLKNS